MEQQPARDRQGPRPASRAKVSAEASIDAVDRVGALMHDLNNLLDGTLRCIAGAQRALDPKSSNPDAIDQARARIEIVRASLERMGEMVFAAMSTSSAVKGTSAWMRGQPITLAEAIVHVTEVLRPEAWAQHVTLETHISPALAGVPAGPLYSVVLNGVKNAIESIRRTGGAGRVLVRAATSVTAESDETEEPAPRKPRSRSKPTPDATSGVVIEIIDDGAGLAPGQSYRGVFEPGVSTKPGSLGLGLPIAREVVGALGGTIELVPKPTRKVAAAGGGTRRGAILRITYPWPTRKALPEGRTGGGAGGGSGGKA